MGEDIYDLYEDSKYNLWISIRMNGIYKRDVHGNFTRYRYDPSNPNNISSNQVRDFVEDNFGNIWFGTFTGLNKYNPTSNQFEVYARNPLPGSMTHSSVFPVYKDRQARSGWGPITAVSIISTRRQIFSRFMQLTTAGTIA